MNYSKIITHHFGEEYSPSQCTLFISTDCVANHRNRAAITPHGALSFKLKSVPYDGFNYGFKVKRKQIWLSDNCT